MRLVCAICRSQSAADNPCPRAPNPFVGYLQRSFAIAPPCLCSACLSGIRGDIEELIPEGGK